METPQSGAERPNPISHPINVTKLPSKGMNLEIKPDVDQRAALARFNDVVSIEDLASVLTITRWQRDGLRVKGDIQASLTQACTVTLEPVSQYLETDIDAVFIPEGSKLHKTLEKGEAHEILVDPEGDDAPETFEHPWLDVGDVVQEFFALAIDPWPRAPGADDLEDLGASDEQTEPAEKPNPFASLAQLKGKL